MTGGERSGKSFTTGTEGTCWALGFTDLIWIVGPDYTQARPEFENIAQDLFKLGALTDKNYSMPKEGACSALTETGCLIETKTAEDVRKLAGKAPGLVLMVEAAQQSYDVFLKLVGRVAEKRGLLFMSGTLEEGAMWYADLYNLFQSPNVFNGRSYSVPSWANLSVYPGGFDDPEIQRLRNVLPEALFRERHEAIPRKPSNLVFPEFEIPAHVSEHYEFVPELEVFLAIDPGFAGAYAVNACHVVGDKLWSFDEIYEVRPETGTDKIINIARQRPWWRSVSRIVMDIAGNAASLTNGQSVAAMWHTETKRDKIGGEQGLYPVGQKVGVTDGIERYRKFLGNAQHPATIRVGYHPRCEGSIREHHEYRYPKRRASINRADSERPVDAHNHAIKAMTYLMVDRFGYYDGPPPVTQVTMYSNYHTSLTSTREVVLPPEFRA